MTTTIKVTYDEIANAINHCIKKLVRPNPTWGPWFDGDEEEAEEWMGDVFIEAVQYFLEGLSIELVETDNEPFRGD